MSPQICRCCSHKDRLKIDQMLVSGSSVSHVAREFAVGYDSVIKHKKEHISRQMAQFIEKRETEQAFSILESIQTILSRVENIFIRSYDKNTSTADIVALKAITEQRSTLELLSKISYALSQAKNAEIELARIQSGEYVIDHQMQFEQSLSILSVNELQMLQALTDKLEKQDASISILPDTSDFPPSFSPRFINSDAGQQSGRTGQNTAPKLLRTKRPLRETWQVRPIEPTQIPG